MSAKHDMQDVARVYDDRDDEGKRLMDGTQYEVPTGFKRWSIVLAAVLGTALFDLTWMIVGVALPHMQGTFSATPDQISWVMTAFIVAGP